MRPGGHPPRVRARAGADRLELLVADVVAVDVAEQDGVDLAEPRVIGAGEVVPDVVEDANPSRIFEQRRAIVRAQLARVRADGRDLHVLRRGRGSERETEQADDAGGLHVVLPWFADQFNEWLGDRPPSPKSPLRGT